MIPRSLKLEGYKTAGMIISLSCSCNQWQALADCSATKRRWNVAFIIIF